MCSNKRVVDLAAGTGKFTAHLLQTGAEVIVVDRVMSVSFIASLSRSEREEVSQQVRRLVNAYPGLSDETDVTFPYRTFVAWTEKSRAGT